MVNSSNSPRKGDVVLGGQNPPPISGAVLGGFVGVKRLLVSGDEQEKVTALFDALNYGEAGLEVVIEALRKESGEVQKKAYLLLNQRTEACVQPVLQDYIPYQFFECLQTIRGHSEEVTSVAVTPDGQQLVSGSGDSTIKIWKLNTAKLVHSIDNHSFITNFLTKSNPVDPVVAVVLTENGQYIISGNAGGIINIWELNTGKLVHSLFIHSRRVNAVALTYDGQYIISGSADGTIRIWKLNASKLVHSIQNTLIPTLNNRFSKVVHIGVNAVVLTHDGQYIISGNADGTIRIWKLNTGKFVRTLPGYSSVNALTLTHNGEHIISGSKDGTIRIRKLNTGKLVRTLVGDSSVNALALTHNGEHIISGSEDGTIGIWDVKRGVLIHSLSGHSEGVNTLALTHNGQHLVSGSSDKTIKIWGIQE